jgi:DNA polymerase-3 subunit gamma/tau
VLNVFGFTSEQTVAGFTGKILRGQTSEALGLLDEQSAAGKEMMKLMSDLIAHLRDLLVFKVKPDALAEEAAPELQSSLGEEAALIETDRVLELIEQFAEAEGRMKWAPNKKLHFEVAVIKAIQTLSQVTLTDVIENLTALRGGSPSVPDVSSFPKIPLRSATKTAPVEKKAPAPKTEKPAAPAATPANSAPVDMAGIWVKAVELSNARRPMLRTWIEPAHYLGTEGRNVLLGFAPKEKTSMEGLLRANNRSFLEALLKEVTGTDWTIKLSLEEGLPSTSPLEETQADTEPSKPKPNDSLDSFKNDPLIKEALEIFKGEIKSVTT